MIPGPIEPNLRKRGRAALAAFLKSQLGGPWYQAFATSDNTGSKLYVGKLMAVTDTTIVIGRGGIELYCPRQHVIMWAEGDALLFAASARQLGFVEVRSRI